VKGSAGLRFVAILLIAAGIVVFATGLYDTIIRHACDERITRSGAQAGRDCAPGTAWAILRIVIGSALAAAGFVLDGLRGQSIVTPLGFLAFGGTGAAVLWKEGSGGARVAAVLIVAIGLIVVPLIARSAARRRRVLRHGTQFAARVQKIHAAGEARSFSGARAYRLELTIQPPGQPASVVKLNHDYRDGNAPRAGDVITVRWLDGRTVAEG
jgi:hypothetical protein